MNDLKIKGLREAPRKIDETLKYFCQRDSLPLLLRQELILLDSVSRQILSLPCSCLPLCPGPAIRVSSLTETNPVNIDLEGIEVSGTPLCLPLSQTEPYITKRIVDSAET